MPSTNVYALESMVIDIMQVTKQTRIDGRHSLAVAREARLAVVEAMARFAAEQPDPAFYKVLDVARRVAGLGSLGVERYVVLVRGPGGGHAQRRPLPLRRVRTRKGHLP